MTDVALGQLATSELMFVVVLGLGLAACSRTEAPEPFNPAVGPVIGLAVQSIEIDTPRPLSSCSSFAGNRGGARSLTHGSPSSTTSGWAVHAS